MCRFSCSLSTSTPKHRGGVLYSGADPRGDKLLLYELLILSGSFVTRYVKTRKKLAKLGNSLIGPVFVGFAARPATLQS